MQNKLQELTDKIYQEGLNKGNEEAEKIISEAKQKAEKIVKDANTEKEKIVNEAGKKANEMAENSKTELKLSFEQAYNSLKQDVANVIDDKILDKLVKESFNDQEFIQNLIQTIVEKWDPDTTGNIDLQVLLPKKDQEQFEKFFKSKAKQILDKGVAVNYNENIKAGFEIAPADGGYKISFTDEVFEQFLKDYLRPKLHVLLFGEK